MLQADLAFRDLSAPIEMIDGALVLGASVVRPLAHRMVQWRVLASPRRLILVVVERFSDDHAPSGAYRDVDDAAIDAELAALDDYLLDFAVLLIDRQAPRIQYRASPVLSVPAYLYPVGGAVLIDWDYARLLDKVTVRPSLDIVLAQIAGRSIDDMRTVVEGLHRVTPDTTITVTPGGVSARYPPVVVYDGPQEIVAEADIEAALFDAVAALIATRPLSAAQTAVDLSGGMDSALTALAAARAIAGNLLSVGARFDGAMGQAQEERRRLIIEQAGFDDLAMPAARFAPFAPGTARRRRHNVMPDDENYPELAEAMFAALRSAGIDTVISGFGGDELYPIYDGEEAPRAAPEPVPPFLSAAGAARMRALSGDYPDSWLQASSWASGGARAQRILRFGLWPIYPYINPSLARFVASLPYGYRRDRALLRKLLTRLLGNAIYETDYIKERFGAVARRGIAQNSDYLREMVRAGPLYAVPEIDGPAIVRALDSSIHDLHKPVYEGLFRALKVFAFFHAGDADDSVT